MNTLPRRQHALPISPSLPEAIEWEEQPSFIGTLSQRLRALGQRKSVRIEQADNDSGWDLTQLGDFDDRPSVLPSLAVVPGLQVRELHQPRLFERFFG